MIDRIERRLFSTLRERLQEAPVLLLEGPRSVGKSTLLAEVSSTMPEARLFDFDDSTVFTLAQQSSRSSLTRRSPCSSTSTSGSQLSFKRSRHA